MSTLKVDTIQKADGTGSLSVPAESGTVVTTASPSLGRRNILLNGDFRVSQRGDYSSATSVTTGNYYLDRWLCNIYGVTATVQQTDVTINGVSKKAAKIVATSSATGFIGLRQIIELTNIPVGETVTASCYVRSNNSNTRFRQNSFGGPAVNADSDAFTNDGNWEKVSWTIETTGTSNTPALWAITYDGASVPVTSGDYIEVTDFQLEVGSVATPFEHRSYGEELALCQRYYYKANNHNNNYGHMGIGSVESSTVINASYMVPVPMRASPSMSKSGTVSAFSGGSFYAVSSFDMYNGGGIMIGTNTVAASGMTSGRAAIIMAHNDTSAYIAFDAEL